MLVIETKFCCALKMYVCVNIVPVHAIKVYDGVEVYLHSFLTLALEGGK
jgi:hypothetical protein